MKLVEHEHSQLTVIEHYCTVHLDPASLNMHTIEHSMQSLNQYDQIVKERNSLLLCRQWDEAQHFQYFMEIGAHI